MRLAALGLVASTAACQVDHEPVAPSPAVLLAPAVAPATAARHLMDCPLGEAPPKARPPPGAAPATSGPIEPIFQALPDANAGPVSLTADGALFAWVGQGGRVVSVSETRSGLCRATLPVEGAFWADILRFSPDGRRLLAGDGKETVIFDLAEGGAGSALTGASVPGRRALADVVWTSAATLSLIRDDGRLERVDASGASLGSPGAPLPPGGPFALHPEGRFVAVVGQGKRDEDVPLSIVDGETGAACGAIGKVRRDRVDALSWSPSGRYLAVVGNDLSVAVHDAAEGGVRVRAKLPRYRHHRFWPLGWSEGGDVLQVASGGRLARLDAARGLALPSTRLPVGREQDIFALATETRGAAVLAFGVDQAFSFDAETGARIATLGDAIRVDPGRQQVLLGLKGRVAVAYDTGICLWDLAVGKLVSVLDRGSAAREEGFILFGSPEGKSVGFLASPHGVYTGPDWGRFLLWDAETGSPRGRMHAGAFATAPAWIDGGARFVWESDHGGASVFDARTLRKVRRAPPRSDAEMCDHPGSSAGAHGAGTICGTEVILSRGPARRRIAAGPAPGGLESPSPSPDGRLLAVTALGENSRDDQPAELRVYEVASGKLLARVEGGGHARWSPDGRSFAVAPRAERAGDLVLYEARTGKALRRLAGPPGSAARSPTFSPDGASIAAEVGPVGGGKGALVVWAVATGALVARTGLTTARFDAPGVAWHGNGVCSTSRDVAADLLLLRLADGESVRVQFASAGEKMGYLASTGRGVFDLQGLPPEAVRLRDGRDVAHAPLLTVAQAARLARPGLVGDLLAGRSLAP